jgi:hypothetical protein
MLEVLIYSVAISVSRQLLNKKKTSTIITITIIIIRLRILGIKRIQKEIKNIQNQEIIII